MRGITRLGGAAIYWPEPETEDDAGKGDKWVGREMRRLMQVRVYTPVAQNPEGGRIRDRRFVTKPLFGSGFPPELPPVPRCQRDVVPPCNGI